MSSRRSLVRHGKSPNAQTCRHHEFGRTVVICWGELRHRQENKAPLRVFHAQIFPSSVRNNLSLWSAKNWVTGPNFLDASCGARNLLLRFDTNKIAGAYWRHAPPRSRGGTWAIVSRSCRYQCLLSLPPLFNSTNSTTPLSPAPLPPVPCRYLRGSGVSPAGPKAAWGLWGLAPAVRSTDRKSVV